MKKDSIRSSQPLNDVELVNYIVEDAQLYNNLMIGEKVNVTPKNESIIKDSEVTSIVRYGANATADEGTVMQATFS